MSNNTQLLKLDWRKHPRLKTNVPLRIRIGSGDFETSTIDVSAEGVLFHISANFKAGTKLDCALLFPGQGRENDRSNDMKIKCKGTVIRSLPSKSGGYDIAILLDKASKKAIKQLGEYVDLHSTAPESVNKTPHLTLNI